MPGRVGCDQAMIANRPITTRESEDDGGKATLAPVCTQPLTTKCHLSKYRRF